MPNKIQRTCAWSGCAALTTSKYCAKHKAQVNTNYYQVRTDKAEQTFYQSKQWTETSKQYRQAHPKCECGCGKESRIVHHKVPLTELLKQGKNPCDWRYLEALSWGCHEKTKKVKR